MSPAVHLVGSAARMDRRVLGMGEYSAHWRRLKRIEDLLKKDSLRRTDAECGLLMQANGSVCAMIPFPRDNVATATIGGVEASLPNWKNVQHLTNIFFPGNVTTTGIFLKVKAAGPHNKDLVQEVHKQHFGQFCKCVEAHELPFAFPRGHKLETTYALVDVSSQLQVFVVTMDTLASEATVELLSEEYAGDWTLFQQSSGVCSGAIDTYHSADDFLQSAYINFSVTAPSKKAGGKARALPGNVADSEICNFVFPLLRDCDETVEKEESSLIKKLERHIQEDVKSTQRNQKGVSKPEYSGSDGFVHTQTFAMDFLEASMENLLEDDLHTPVLSTKVPSVCRTNLHVTCILPENVEENNLVTIVEIVRNSVQLLLRKCNRIVKSANSLPSQYCLYGRLYQVPGCAVPVGVIYMLGNSNVGKYMNVESYKDNSMGDASYDRVREGLSKLFSIQSSGVPCFRTYLGLERKMKSDFRRWPEHQEVIEDMHQWIPVLGTAKEQQRVPGGTLHLTRGHYAYYHYLQQKFNDNQWGCAYRSFQTIFSWFRYQGYTSRTTPPHDEIQGILARMDPTKPKNFVGSRQWIGSIDLQYLLMDILDVQSRLISVNSGEELPGKGRELAQHFEIQGTPIMIGGNNLAFTILGVDYNENTGEIRYLILDPHYTGTDEFSDMTTIVRKGWCAWKPADFFKKHCFYNLCLPLVEKDMY